MYDTVGWYKVHTRGCTREAQCEAKGTVGVSLILLGLLVLLFEGIHFGHEPARRNASENFAFFKGE